MGITREIKNLALIGFMGTGKSTIGRLVARRLNYEFVDTDLWIESRLNHRISEIFDEKGEEWFRNYERQILLDMNGYDRTVFATGGGMAANPANVALLKEHALVVCLWGTPETIYERTRYSSHRPLLNTTNPLERIRQLLQSRSLSYKMADVLIRIEQRTQREIMDLILYNFSRELKAHTLKV